MLIITNAINDRVAFIAHCSHEDIEDFAKASGLARKICPIYPAKSTEGEFAIFSDRATHWTMEPSALYAFEAWLKDSGLYCQYI